MTHIIRMLNFHIATTSAIVALALLAPSAQAGLLVESTESCPQETLERPFLRWADPASYVLAPEGTLETATAWRLTGTTRSLGNESYYVHGADERYSLALPEGSSATTATMCVGLEHPTLRLFVRNAGSPLSLLQVDAIVQDSLGLRHVVPMGAVAGTSTWAPTPPLAVVANLLPLPPGERTPVAFRFTPEGGDGAWRIDDVYVDPYRK